MEKPSKTEWNKYIDDSNEAFFAASREQKRSMIAKDVIEQLNRRYINANSSYFSAYIEPSLRNEDMKDILRTIPVCTVCGIGALLVTAVQRLDKLSYNNLVSVP